MAATVYSLSDLTLAKSEGLAVCQMIDFVNTIAFGEFLFSKWRLNKNYGEKRNGRKKKWKLPVTAVTGVIIV